jgi:CBS domain-containing protein
VGMITSTDLVHHQTSSPLYLRRTLDHLAQPAELAHYARDVAGVVQVLYRSGLGASQIAQIVSSLNDALVKRLVYLAEQALGPPPTAFAWIVFGSEGRLEQMLLTDQDNALIFSEASVEAQAYFTALASRVVDSLIQVGFPPCPGGYMATNWCKPLDVWQQLFPRWVLLPEAQALLEAAIFFDFRPVVGTLSLTPLEELLASAQTVELFILHMLRTALLWGPPLGFFNRLRSDHGMVDIKRGGIAPIVSLARVGALAAGSHARSTLERLVVAGQSEAILSRDHATMLAEIFPFLLHIRLRQQLAALQAHQPVEHKVRLAELSTLERRHLKEAFVVIRQIQDVIRASWHLERIG